MQLQGLDPSLDVAQFVQTSTFEVASLDLIYLNVLADLVWWILFSA